jgi:hypothetical protein
MARAHTKTNLCYTQEKLTYGCDHVNGIFLEDKKIIFIFFVRKVKTHARDKGGEASQDMKWETSGTDIFFTLCVVHWHVCREAVGYGDWYNRKTNVQFVC